MCRRWDGARTGVDLTVTIDHYRELYEPVMKVINQADDHDEGSHLTVVIPEFTTRHWWEALLHNQSAWLLKAELAKRPNTVTISVPLRPLEAPTGAAEDVPRRAASPAPAMRPVAGGDASYRAGGTAGAQHALRRR